MKQTVINSMIMALNLLKRRNDDEVLPDCLAAVLRLQLDIQNLLLDLQRKALASGCS